MWHELGGSNSEASPVNAEGVWVLSLCLSTIFRLKYYKDERWLAHVGVQTVEVKPHTEDAIGSRSLHGSPVHGTDQEIREEDEEIEAEGANYQLEMMRCLREVNVDNNTVGW
ncbi:hypothetical protein Tco_0812964 [Tanacetum coccineum]